MSGVRQGSHLEHLHELRDRIDAEIVKERTRMALADQRRAVAAAAQEERDRLAAIEAEKEAARAARRDEARAERERIAAERLAEVERIEAAAPADLVRAWARETGITVGDRGRLPLDLRKQYIEATNHHLDRSTTA